MAPASLRPLRHRSFRLLFAAGTVSNIGTWLQTVAIGALVTDLTGQAAWTTLAAAATFLPIGLLSPVGGALADRVDRRRFLLGANVVEASLATALAVVVGTGRASAGVLVLIAALAGCVGGLKLPFYQSLLPDLVPDRADLLAAISLNSAQYNLGRILGPSIAAAVIAIGSFSLAFALNAMTFFAVITALALVRIPHRPPSERVGLFRSIRLGGRAARAEPGCRSAILLIALVALLVAPFIALIPAVAASLVDGGAKATAKATGLLTTAQGVGAVVGALALAPLAVRYGRRRMLVVNLVATPVAVSVYALTPSLGTAIAALAAVGALYIGVLSGLSTVVQLRAPEAYRGRILSLYMVSLGCFYPVGALVQGVTADRIGLAPTTVVTAMLLLAALAAIALLRPATFAALDDPDQVSPATEAAVAEAPVPSPEPSAPATR